MAIDESFESSLHIYNTLGGDVGIFLNAQIGANGAGLGIVLYAQPGLDDLLDLVGDRHGWLMHICDAARGEPSELLPILLDLGLLFM